MADVLSSEALLRVARVTHRTTAEGPHSRTAIWVQGCSIRCRGCINPHLFTTRGGSLTEPGLIVEGALSAGDEGLTLVGGEPLDQGKAVTKLSRLAQRAGLGVICFSGYTVETIRKSTHGEELLQFVDLLVDGPYLADSPDAGRALVGSSNQRFIHLSSRYSDYQPVNTPNRIDVRILPSGEVSVAGFLTAKGVEDLTMAFDARRSTRP